MSINVSQDHYSRSSVSFSERFGLCPVCGQTFPRLEHGIYCSKACGREAYNFRKRIAPLNQFLKRLDFKTRYHNGVHLEVELSDTLKYHYAVAVDHLFWPLFAVDIATLNQDGLWLALENNFGVFLMNYAHWLFDRYSGHGDALVVADFKGALSEPTVSELFYMAANTAIRELSVPCVNCNCRLIRSPLTMEIEENRYCVHCDEMVIPF